MAATADQSLQGSHGAARSKAAVVGALGVVFGDIGTSPLYALKEAVHAASGGAELAPQTVLAGC